jgi:DNA-binding MarR family transcriptional regulator
MARFGHEIHCIRDRAPLASGETLDVWRAAEQFKGSAACKRRCNPLANAEHGADDLQSKWCHSAGPSNSFSNEHVSSNMNNKQDLPWDNPRFRNWVAVARACHALERSLAAKLAPLDLKPAQLDVLMNLYRHPGMSQHDLARKLLVGRSNITMLLPQLEKRGLVLRESDCKDKRILRLALTEDGTALLMEALKIHSALIEVAMSQSTPDQCDLIGEQMRKVAEALNGS